MRLKLGLRLKLELRLGLRFRLGVQSYISKFLLLLSGGVGGGGVEKWRLKLISAKLKVEVEAELGNFIFFLYMCTLYEVASSTN